MVKKVAAKTAGISMAGFQPREKVFDRQTPPSPTSGSPSEVAPSSPGTSSRPFTGVGNVMAAITREAEVTHELTGVRDELADVRNQLAQFSGAKVERALDPKSIRRSRWANRDLAEFDTVEFKELKDEIASAGGNVQPIKVRALHPDSLTKVFDGQTPLFEIAYGHRRHQACFELGLPVIASVEQSMSDKELFEVMDRENRGRKNLSAWEQGRMYSDALSTGLYPSMRKMAESLGVNLSDASRSVQIAKLPATVVAAFASPLDIQFRWAKPLTDALQKDPDGVLAIAKQLTDDRARRSPTEVFEQLVGKEAKAVSAEIDVSAAGQVVARISSKGKGQTIVVFEPNVLSVEKVQALAKLLSEFLAK